jgi:hypothetical protein
VDCEFGHKDYAELSWSIRRKKINSYWGVPPEHTEEDQHDLLSCQHHKQTMWSKNVNCVEIMEQRKN